MNSKIINVLVFAAGAAIGSAVTWKVVKSRYDRIIAEEIESVKEAFAESDVASSGEPTEPETDDEEDLVERPKQIDWDELEDLDEDDNEDMVEYSRIVANYTNEKGGARNMANEPKVISPYDFGELDGYHQIELTYYADGFLEDDDYNIVEDAEELLGPDALNTFGEYEEDAVFVRNDFLRTDFQILRDYRTYEEARSAGPGRVND
jgi:hypothetical protein